MRLLPATMTSGQAVGHCGSGWLAGLSEVGVTGRRVTCGIESVAWPSALGCAGSSAAVASKTDGTGVAIGATGVALEVAGVMIEPLEGVAAAGEPAAGVEPLAGAKPPGDGVPPEGVPATESVPPAGVEPLADGVPPPGVEPLVAPALSAASAPVTVGTEPVVPFWAPCSRSPRKFSR